MTSAQPSAAAPRPFALAPDARCYFPAQAAEEARQRICRSVERGEGPVLVIGSAGLGKTMLLSVVAAQFAEQLRAVTVVGGQLCTRRALLQMVLFQLDLPYRDMDESELRLSLLAYLQSPAEESRRILLLVDEADALPPRLLEELRTLTNLSRAGQPLVHLVLAGSPTLEELFADPKQELFSQRIAARCYLSAFGREESFQYVRAQVASAGHDPAALFSNDGLEAVFAATDGAPRLLNQLGDQLLWKFSESGSMPLDNTVVQQAWSELQQLPAPWNTQTSEASGAAIEFGELCSDDEGLEELVLEEEEESYSIVYEEDQPASIPINGSTRSAVETDPCKSSAKETFDATEQLLAQLHEMDAAEGKSEITTSVEIAARNPFAENFESEELVLDRYATFESLLLAEAPKVVNHTDATFADQLKELEITDTPASLPQLGDHEHTNAQSQSQDLRETELPTFSEYPGAESLSLCSDEATAATMPEEPGEVLLIEDNERPQTSIVQGQKFRQLFSRLEQGEESQTG